MKLISTLAFSVLASTITPLLSAVVAGTNVALLVNTIPVRDEYTLRVQVEPAGGATSADVFWRSLSGSAIVFIQYLGPARTNWYLAEFGDSFTGPSILGDEFLVLFENSPPLTQNNQREVGFGDFFLAFNTDNRGEESIEIPRDHYGWVHLRNTQVGITLLDSAIAYNSDGIVVGTTTVIPEASSAALVACGVLFLCHRRRRSEAEQVIAPNDR